MSTELSQLFTTDCFYTSIKELSLIRVLCVNILYDFTVLNCLLLNIKFASYRRFEEQKVG